jgi:RNA polymerase sigma-70 factor, ECF subfamily
MTQRLSTASGSASVVSDVAGAIPIIADGLRAKHPAAESDAAPLRLVIERAQAGDAAAFDRLIVCFQRKVVSTAWRILGNQDDALDAAQEVFIRLHRYLRTFKADQDFAAWLYRLIINACHDTRKRRSRYVSLEQEKERGSLEHLRADDDVEATAIMLQDEAIIARALDTLSEKERAALVLRDLEGLETEEVARILGSSATTVRSQISSARAKIRAFRDKVFKQGREG